MGMPMSSPGGGLGPGAGRGRKAEYLDFDWESSGNDDLADARNKYEDFLRQETTSPPGYGYTQSRRRTLGSRQPYPPGSFDLWEDDYEDYEDTGPPPPRETEKRYMNGSHILTNREITCVAACMRACMHATCLRLLRFALRRSSQRLPCPACSAPMLRLTGPSKEALGMKPTEDALKMAEEQVWEGIGVPLAATGTGALPASQWLGPRSLTTQLTLILPRAGHGPHPDQPGSSASSCPRHPVEQVQV